MTEEPGSEGTLIEVLRAGTWPAENAVVGSIRLANPQLTVREEAGNDVVELSGECAPGDLSVGQPYRCTADANHISWAFRGALAGQPTAGPLRGRQFFHHVTVRSISSIIAHRIERP